MRGVRSIVAGRRLRLLALLVFGIVAVFAPHCTDTLELPTVTAGPPAQASSVEHHDAIAPVSAAPADEGEGSTAGDLLGVCLAALLALVGAAFAFAAEQLWLLWIYAAAGRTHRPAMPSGPPRYAVSPLSLGISRT